MPTPRNINPEQTAPYYQAENFPTGHQQQDPTQAQQDKPSQTIANRHEHSRRYFLERGHGLGQTFLYHFVSTYTLYFIPLNEPLKMSFFSMIL